MSSSAGSADEALGSLGATDGVEGLDSGGGHGRISGMQATEDGAGDGVSLSRAPFPVAGEEEDNGMERLDRRRLAMCLRQRHGFRPSEKPKTMFDYSLLMIFPI